MYDTQTVLNSKFCHFSWTMELRLLLLGKNSFAIPLELKTIQFLKLIKHIYRFPL